jgi:hypothetical protein
VRKDDTSEDDPMASRVGSLEDEPGDVDAVVYGR